MSFSYGSKSRHRAGGRHFKLFSDELPRIEFDKASLEEYNQDNTSPRETRRRTRGRRRTFRDTNHDRFSLPSLGTPEWDKLSDSERGRPQSYSPFNPLNPNFAKIHKKIQRRHTLRETKVSEWEDSDDNFRIRLNESIDKQQYTSAWHAKVRKSKVERDQHKASKCEIQNDLSGNERSNSSESLNKPLVEKPPIPKKKSLFKELLDASAKENERMNRIKEGLKFKEDNVSISKSYKLSLINQTKRDLANANGIDDEENVVPEVISESSENLKPGILKHGVRERESNVIKTTKKKDFPTKHRLIHQEDLPLYGHDGSKAKSSSGDEVRVSVYADTPMNRMTDMMFIPLPSSKPKDKQKKVNFHDHIDIKERTAMSELMELDEDNDVDDELDALRDTDSANENVNSEQKKKSVQIRRRTNVRNRDLAKSLQKHTVTIKNRYVNGETENDRSQTISKGTKKNQQRDRREDRRDYIDSILMSSSNNHLSKELRSRPIWKEAKPAVEEVLIHEPDPVDVIAIANSPVELVANGLDTVNNHYTRHESSDRSQNLHYTENKNISRGLLASPPRSPVRSPPRSPIRSPDLDTISDFTTYFDDELNFDDLPEEIDRSMLGEDLIKAYRFWDRKRKAFPSGLRKIEAPAERNDSTYPKQYGNVKTYKITNARFDKQPLTHTSTHNKNSQNSALVNWV